MSKTLIVGCNYHTTWQSDSRMRFVLNDLIGDNAQLKTRTTGKLFWAKTRDLIFIQTSYNIQKGKNLMQPKLHKLKCFGMTDQPTDCPECGARSDFFELGKLQIHNCPQCKFEFKVV